MRDIRQNSAGQIQPILNAEQQAKWQEMRSRGRHGMGMGSGQPPQGTPPNPQ